MQNYAEDYYRQTQDPNWQTDRLHQIILRNMPQLRSLLEAGRSDLTSRGFGSSSPMNTANSRAIGSFTSNMTSDFYKNLDQDQMQLLQILMQQREAEKQRKAQKEAGLWGGIGSLLGNAVRFIPGIGQVAGMGMDAYSQGGGGQQSYMPYQAPRMNFTPQDYNSYRRY
jgi:hypothetical protein